MKFRITKENIEGYNTELKIRRMNYDQVVVNYPSDIGLKVFDKKDVEYEQIALAGDKHEFRIYQLIDLLTF